MGKPSVCKRCGAEIPAGTKVCPACGRKRAKPIYKRVWFYVLLLFAVSMAISTQMNSIPDGQRMGTSLLAKEMRLNQEQETRMLDIFSQCGIGELDSVELFQEGGEESSYYVEDNETKAYRGAENTIVVWISNETKEVRAIYFHDQDIYADGRALAKVSDFYVGKEDRDKYRVTVQMLVNKLLLAPDSAKYPAQSGWTFGIEEGVVTVQSSVKSQNAFGVEVESKFQVRFKDGNPFSLILDGQEYIE